MLPRNFLKTESTELSASVGPPTISSPPFSSELPNFSYLTANLADRRLLWGKWYFKCKLLAFHYPILHLDNFFKTVRLCWNPNCIASDGQSKAGDQICKFYFPKPVLWAETLRSFAPCLIHHEAVKLRLLNQERLADRQQRYIRLRPPSVVLNYLSIPFVWHL